MNSVVLNSKTPIPATTGPLFVQWLVNEVKAGFPSPAEDMGMDRIDLNQILMTHPQATYFMRATGLSMIEHGIADGDILVISKAKQPRHGHIVIAVLEGEFTVKKLFKRYGRIKLQAGNPTYPDIMPKDEQTLSIWGVVTACIKLFPT